jgi:hypothetical protein
MWDRAGSEQQTESPDLLAGTRTFCSSDRCVVQNMAQEITRAGLWEAAATGRGPKDLSRSWPFAPTGDLGRRSLSARRRCIALRAGYAAATDLLLADHHHGSFSDIACVPYCALVRLN